MSLFSRHPLNILKAFGNFVLYYFVQYHGKSELDGRFGLVSQVLAVLRLYIIMETIEDLQRELSKKLSTFNTDVMTYVVTMFVFICVCADVCVEVYLYPLFYFALVAIQHRSPRCPLHAGSARGV
jgi:hypothetical protein